MDAVIGLSLNAGPELVSVPHCHRAAGPSLNTGPDLVPVPPTALPLLQAQQIMPSMPYVDMKQVGRLRGMMGAIVLNSALMDLAVRQSAQQNLREVEVFADGVSRALG
jgi:hypothetical protein